MAPEKDWLTIPLLICSSVFLVVTWIFVLTRLGVRAFIVKTLYWDDYMLVLAAGMYAAFLGCLIKICQLELYESLANVETVKSLVAYLTATNVCYIAATIFFKISLAMFYKRILDRKWQKYLIWTCVVVYTIFATAWFFLDLFRCGNPSDSLKIITGPCWKWNIIGPLTYIHSVLNAVTDWVFAVTPCFTIWRAQMPTRERVTVLALCLIAMVGSVCSILRLAYLDVLKGDPFYIIRTAPKLGMMSEAEVGLGIVALCMAAMRPLWKLIKGQRSNLVTGRKGTHAAVTERSGSLSGTKIEKQTVYHVSSTEV